jgi:hypothetical protein
MDHADVAVDGLSEELMALSARLHDLLGLKMAVLPLPLRPGQLVEA